MQHHSLVSACVLSTFLAIGCAADLPRHSTLLTPASAQDPAGVIEFTSSVKVKPPSLYSSTIPAGSAWQLAGRLPEGEVYRPIRGTVFALESANVHEAFLVIDGSSLVGAYLPVERAFVTVQRVDNLPLLQR
jgi:hypothetical protein